MTGKIQHIPVASMTCLGMVGYISIHVHQRGDCEQSAESVKCVHHIWHIQESCAQPSLYMYICTLYSHESGWGTGYMGYDLKVSSETQLHVHVLMMS